MMDKYEKWIFYVTITGLAILVWMMIALVGLSIEVRQ